MVNFLLTPEQLELRNLAKKFAKDYKLSELSEQFDVAHDHDTQKSFKSAKSAYEVATKLGFSTGFVPNPETGEVMVSNMDIQLVAEELAYHNAGFACILLVNGLALLPIWWYASDDQKKRWLSKAVNASEENTSFLAGWSVSEPNGTANFETHPNKPRGIKTTCSKTADGNYRLVGEKMWPSSSAGWDMTGCDLDVIIARFPDHNNELGIVVVENGGKGWDGEINYHPPINKFAQRTNQNNDVTYDIAVPKDNVFGIGSGDLAISKAFSWSGPVAGIAAVGNARAMLDKTLDWARTYYAGGDSPIINHQVVGYALAESSAKLEAARALCWKAACHLDSNNYESHGLCAMAKVYATETAQDVINTLAKVMGINSTLTFNRVYHHILEASMFTTYDAGNMGMQMRKIWSVIQDPDFNSTLYSMSEPFEFTKKHVNSTIR